VKNDEVLYQYKVIKSWWKFIEVKQYSSRKFFSVLLGRNSSNNAENLFQTVNQHFYCKFLKRLEKQVVRIHMSQNYVVETLLQQHMRCNRIDEKNQILSILIC